MVVCVLEHALQGKTNAKKIIEIPISGKEKASGKVRRRRFFFTDTLDGFNSLMGQTKFYQNKGKSLKTLSC